jgi:hypothetical protein
MKIKDKPKTIKLKKMKKIKKIKKIFADKTIKIQSIQI